MTRRVGAASGELSASPVDPANNGRRKSGSIPAPVAAPAPMCESDRGEWGQRCPDCGKRLPARQKPLTSWMAARSTDAEASAKASAAITDAMQMHLSPRRRKAA
jgi:hypothetical protein